MMKAMSAGQTRYVLLCRHGPHRNHELLPTGDPPQLPVAAVAARLQEQLIIPTSSGEPAIKIRRIVHSSEAEVEATAYHLCRAISAALSQPVAIAQCIRHLHPAAFPQRLEGAADDDLDGALINKLLTDGTREDGDAVLIVGHQPHLSWLSHALLARGRLPRRSYAVPIATAELVCIAVSLQQGPGDADWNLGGRARLLWTIAPDDKAAAEEIRGKIRSKMDTAKVLAAVITFGLGAQLGILLDPARCQALSCRVPAQLSTGLLFTALLLYLAAMYAYDGLLMPDRFWADKRPRASSPRRACLDGATTTQLGCTSASAEHDAGVAWLVHDCHRLCGGCVGGRSTPTPDLAALGMDGRRVVGGGDGGHHHLVPTLPRHRGLINTVATMRCWTQGCSRQWVREQVAPGDHSKPCPPQ